MLVRSLSFLDALVTFMIITGIIIVNNNEVLTNNKQQQQLPKGTENNDPGWRKLKLKKKQKLDALLQGKIG